MAKKKLIIIIISLLGASVFAALAVMLVLHRSVSSNFISKAILSGKIDLAKDIIYVPVPDTKKFKDNSLLGAKEAVTHNDCVFLDIAFLSDGTPVLADTFVEAENDSVPLRLIFEHAKDRNGFIFYLNLTELNGISELNTLILEYEMIDRIIFVGLTESSADYVRKFCTYARFYLDIDFDSSMKDNEKYCNKIMTEAQENGAFGIHLNAKSLTKQLSEAAVKSNLRIIVIRVKRNSDFMRLLPLNGLTVVTEYMPEITEIYSKAGDRD